MLVVFNAITCKKGNISLFYASSCPGRKTLSLSSWNLEAGSHGGFGRRGGSRLIGPRSHSSISSNSIFKYFLKFYVRVFLQILYLSVSSKYLRFILDLNVSANSVQYFSIFLRSATNNWISLFHYLFRFDPTITAIKIVCISIAAACCISVKLFQDFLPQVHSSPAAKSGCCLNKTSLSQKNMPWFEITSRLAEKKTGWKELSSAVLGNSREALISGPCSGQKYKVGKILKTPAAVSNDSLPKWWRPSDCN